MSVVIVEGPDGGGKTTLAGRLVERYQPHARSSHHGSYALCERIAPFYMADLCNAFAAPAGQVVVMDRSWLSEPIYGAAARGGADRVSPRELAALNAVANGCGAVVVLCLPPLQTCRQAWEARIGAEYLKHADQLAEVHRAYGAAARLWRGSLPVVLYDYTFHVEAALFDQVDHLVGRGTP